MSFAPTLSRSPVSAKSVGLLVAALALGTGSTIASVATASHSSLPAVATQAQQQSTTTDTQDAADTTSSTDTSTSTNSNTNSTAGWGQQAVAICKAAPPTTGTHGIGKCVSTWVLQHNGGSSHHSSH